MQAKRTEFESEGSTTSLSLLERAKANDERAWDRIVKIYSPLVYRLCRISRLQSNDARDISQEVFRAAFRNIKQVRRDRPGDSFRAWLLTIAKNKIKDHFRRQQKKPAATGGTDMLTQIHQLPDLNWESSNDGSNFDSDSNIVTRAIRLAKGDFAQHTWDAFWQTTIEGRSTDEVSSTLGLSKWSVYQAKSRVLRRIREDLDGLVD